MIEIMCDNISIGEENIINGEKVIALKENVKEGIVPFDLFKNGSYIASGEEFVNWLEDLEEKDVFVFKAHSKK